MLNSRSRGAAVGLALAVGIAGTGVGSFVLVAGGLHDAALRGAGTQFATSERTMEAGAWFSDRGLLRGVRFDRARFVDGLILELVPAPGVELPTGAVETGGVRFNEDGEVVEILPATDDAPCITLLTQDPGNPRRWFINCLGDCPADGPPCAIMIDLTTLEMACECPSP